MVRVLSDRFHQHRSLKVGDIGRLLHSRLRSPNLCHRGGPTRPTASAYCDWLSSTHSRRHLPRSCGPEAVARIVRGVRPQETAQTDRSWHITASEGPIRNRMVAAAEQTARHLHDLAHHSSSRFGGSMSTNSSGGARTRGTHRPCRDLDQVVHEAIGLVPEDHRRRRDRPDTPHHGDTTGVGDLNNSRASEGTTCS